MKQKLLTVCLVICLLAMSVTLSGCDELDVFTSVTSALENTNKLDSVDVTMTIDVKATSEGETLSMPITADMKMSGLLSKKPLSRIVMTSSLLGQDITIDMYQEGDWVYMTQDGTNYKMNLKTFEQDMGDDYDYSAQMGDLLQALPETLLKNTEFVIEKDGGKTIAVNLTDEQLNDLYKDYLGSVADILEDNALTSNGRVSITVKDDYVAAYNLHFTQTVRDGETVISDGSVDVSLVFHNPGKIITVKAPAGYQEYPDFADILGDFMGDLGGLDTNPDEDVSSDVDPSDEDFDLDFDWSGEDFNLDGLLDDTL